MLNLIRADLYRLRHGVVVRNVCIILFAVTALVALACMFMNSDMFRGLMETEAAERMDVEDYEQFRAELQEVPQGFVSDVAAFSEVVVSENILYVFFIPIVLTVFCADFTDGTYRNTLSYESDRRKVYLAKLGLSIVICLLLQIFMVLSSWLIGAIFFKTLGFSAAYFSHMAILMLLLLPGQLAAVCFLQALIAFTKKSSATIGSFIGISVGISVVAQLLSLIPQFKWVVYLDWSSVGELLQSYQSIPGLHLALVVGAGLAVAAVSTVVGLRHYQSADLTL